MTRSIQQALEDVNATDRSRSKRHTDKITTTKINSAVSE